MSVEKTDNKAKKLNTQNVSENTSNNDKKHCICLKKLYDWVKTRNGQQIPFQIPASDLVCIERAIIIGHTVSLTAVADCENATINVSLIERIDDNCACITLEKIIEVEVTIVDETEDEILSEFTQTIQIFDTVRVCFPVGMPQSAINAKLLDCQSVVLSSRPVGGVITVEIITCQEIKICLEVVAKIKLESFCFSREGEACDDILGGSEFCVAGDEVYPEQCESECIEASL